MRLTFYSSLLLDSILHLESFKASTPFRSRFGFVAPSADAAVAACEQRFRWRQALSLLEATAEAAEFGLKARQNVKLWRLKGGGKERKRESFREEKVFLDEFKGSLEDLTALLWSAAAVGGAAEHLVRELETADVRRLSDRGIADVAPGKKPDEKGTLTRFLWEKEGSMFEEQ